MTIVVMILLFVIAALLAILNYKKMSIALLLLAVIGSVVIGSGLLPYLLLQQWQSSYTKPDEIKWAKRSVIVVLGGGIAKIPHTNQVQAFILADPRIMRGAQLYDACKKSDNECKLLISGGDVHHLGKSEAVVYGDELRALNVNAKDIVLEEDSKSTYENAKYTHQILKNLASDQIYLVTSGVHMKRALWSFAQFGVVPQPILSDYTIARFSITPRAYNFVVTDAVLHEYLGMLKYRFFNSEKSN